MKSKISVKAIAVSIVLLFFMGIGVSMIKFVFINPEYSSDVFRATGLWVGLFGGVTGTLSVFMALRVKAKKNYYDRMENAEKKGVPRPASENMTRSENQKKKK